MPIHIIIDGYNLIRNSNSLSALDRQDMQTGRETLVDMLATYKGAVKRSTLGKGTFHSVIETGFPYAWPLARYET